MEDDEENIMSYEDKIHDKRLYNKNNQQDEKCCEDYSVKIITTHGALLNDIISLPQGYKVIFLADFGNCMASRSTDHTELKNIYARGNSLFEDDDTIPKLSKEGLDLIFNWQINNQALGFSVNPTLFIGGEPKQFSDINGNVYSIPVNIPNVSLDFYGENCNNWDGNYKQSCMISCIKYGENPEGEDAICDKYYGSQIKLRELLGQEGPGTYVLSTCLGGSIFSEQLLNYLNYGQMILKNSGITKTRSQDKDLTEKLNFLKEYLESNPANSLDVKMDDTFFGKSKKSKSKKSKSKSKKSKSKSKKSKSKKSKSKVNLELKRLQKKAKKLKIRITKKVKGKRKYKTIKQLKNEIKIKLKKYKFGTKKYNKNEIPKTTRTSIKRIIIKKDKLQYCPHDIQEKISQKENHIDYLGNGTFGYVFKIVHKNKQRACKIIQIHFEGYATFLKEVYYQNLISSYNIAPKVYDNYLCKTNTLKYGIIIMDYLHNYLTFINFLAMIYQLSDEDMILYINLYINSLIKVVDIFVDQINLYTADFQFMIKNDATDIKLIDFGETTTLTLNKVLRDEDEEEDITELKFSSKQEYKDYILDIYINNNKFIQALPQRLPLPY